ncbi:hypothetical protein H8U11_003622 [Salmonella enterica]|nr:hypothetical protein [Salmonella enterica]
MKTAIKREINALNRISQNVINASVNKFDLIPFVYAGPRTADGRRVVYLDVLAWYPRSVWKRVWRDFRCILGNHNWVGFDSYRRELLDKARRLVESELLAEAAV